MAGCCSRLCWQFLLLLWKNFKLQFRKPIWTTVELVLPTLAVLFIIFIRYGLADSGQDQCFVTFDSDMLSIPDNVPVLQNRIKNVYNIFYSPRSKEADSVMELVCSQLNLSLSSADFNIKAFAAEDEMVTALMSLENSTQMNTCFHSGAGIVFENLTGNQLSYKIRLRHEVGLFNTWFTALTEPRFELPGPRVENLYLAEGFLHLQKLVGEAIIQWKAVEREVAYQPVGVAVRQFPYPAYYVDGFLSILQSFLPLLFILAFIFSAALSVKELVLEKETRIRETMFMMGLKQWILWSTWFVKQFIFLMISVTICSILLKVFVFINSDFILMFIFFTLFIISMISYCFLVSVWFNSSRVGLVIGFVAWFANYIPFLFTNVQFDTFNLGSKLGFCLFSNTCMGFGVIVLSRQELSGTGITWSNVASPINVDDNFSMIWVLVMLIIDSVLYMLVAWYVNGVKPGMYGISKPFYFPFLPSYWCCTSSRPSKMRDQLEQGVRQDPLSHEEVDDSLQVGISIQNITKIYSPNIFSRKKGRMKAVDKLNLNMYTGQITALLGHNGAGKTTTMSILTGLYTPTEGTAYINGRSILTDMDLIRKNFGICPQHNILFDRLTVSEHLYFFLHLKGIHSGIKKEVNQMIEDLHLLDKRNIQAGRLSGGQKRKLSVGIALIGGSKVVILDEPTSGMDPYARRATWDLLTKYKKDRCIVLSTHYMDEADLLGDRIAILAEGKLRCSGSSLFLKKRYGVGYHLTIVKEGQCVSSKVSSMVKSFVSTAEQVLDVGAELTFTLPSSESSNFPKLFDQLEENKEALGVQSFGVSVTTMEEVFIKVGEGTDDTLEQSVRYGSMSSTNVQKDKNSDIQSVDLADTTCTDGNRNMNNDERRLTEDLQLSYNFKPNKGVTLWLQQFWAMFVKRVYNSLRFYPALIIQFPLPILSVIISLLVVISIPAVEDDPPRELLMNNSGLDPKNVTLFYADFGDTMNFSDFSAGDLLVTNYLDIREVASDILEEITRVSDVRDCCKYENQLLDKFCASRPAGELKAACKDNSTFGYHRCIDTCLSCCDAANAMISSCTHPLSMPVSSSESFCPSPPSLSLFANKSGRLDTMNTYVAEYLLRASLELDPIVFFRRYQAGFTITAQDPIVSICDCNNCTLFERLTIEMRNSSEPEDTCPVYLAEFSRKSNETLCSNQPSCFSVEPLSANFLQILSCNASVCGAAESRPVSKVYPEQLPTPAVTVWYSNDPYHMPAAALNAYQSLRLKQVMGNKDLSLIVINHPLPRNNESSTMAATNDFTGFILSIFIVFGYGLLLSSFVLFLVKEKESKAKHLQFVSGVGASSYWLASFAWDLLNALLPVILTVVVFAAFQLDAYKGTSLGAVFLILFLTCWASIPLTYIFSALFSNSLAAFSVLYIFYSLLTTMLLTTVVLVKVLVSNGDSTSKVLHHIFLLLPTYGLASALNDIYLNQNLKDLCLSRLSRSQCENSGTYVDNPLNFSYPGVGVVCLYLFVEGIVFFAITILIEYKFFYPELKHLCACKKDAASGSYATQSLLPGEDSDVHAEKVRVMTESSTVNEDVVVIKNLVKIYSPHLSGCTIRPAKKAVSGISLGIPKGECFGLLGVNGAGKTTTFSILTGDIRMTSGTSIIAGYDIRISLKNVQRRIGYCPQFDALIDHLTGRELLVMFARLRGIPEQQIKEVVDTEVHRLDLKKHATKKCGSYSGGNKRKLSTAIALVGNPPIVMLDEPTTGMDPNTRHYLWDVLTKVIHEGRSIILTSHSMEECEALCTRLAIMVNGQFKCLGSIQHIKNKFGSGYTLHAKVKIIPKSEQVEEVVVRRRFSLRRQSSRTSAQGDQQAASPPIGSSQSVSGREQEAICLVPHDTTSLRIFIQETFRGAVLLEEHQGAVTYQLPSAGLKWSSVFRQLEGNKDRLGIVDYSVSQTTLEQVFINFAKDQEEEHN